MGLRPAVFYSPCSPLPWAVLREAASPQSTDAFKAPAPRLVRSPLAERWVAAARRPRVGETHEAALGAGSGILSHQAGSQGRRQARPSPHLRAPAASCSGPAPPPRLPRADSWRGAPGPRAHAAGGANRGLCVQTAQWAVAVGGDAGGARPMGCGLSALIGRRTHTHSATRAPAGPTRAERFCAGRIVCRGVPPAGLVPRRRCPRAPGPSPSAAHGIQTREGGAPGRRRGPRTPPAPHGAAAAAGNRRPWASGGWTCGARAEGRPRPPPRGPRARRLWGHRQAAPARAELPRPGSSSPGQAGPGSSPARRTPLGRSGRTSAVPGPAALTHLRSPPTGQPGGRMSPGGTSLGRTSPRGGEREPGHLRPAQGSACVFVPIRQFPGTGSSLPLPVRLWE